MCYNLGFVLGDPSNDGHGVSEEYHIVSTHSRNQITKAYNEFVDKYSIDFISMFEEYECGRELPEDVKTLFTSLNIKYYKLYYTEEFILQFFNIIKFMIPDFEWDFRNLEENYLDILNGGAYGIIL